MRGHGSNEAISLWQKKNIFSPLRSNNRSQRFVMQSLIGTNYNSSPH